MEPPVLLFVGLTLFFTKISAASPGNEDTVETEPEDERRSFASAHAHASAANQQYRPLVRPTDECYACTDCPRILSNTTVRQCGHSPVRCVVYSEKYNYIGRPVYVRGCVSERGSCEDIKRSHQGHHNVVKMLSCEECTGDKCNVNGVPRSLPDLTIYLFFITITPLVTKFALS